LCRDNGGDIAPIGCRNSAENLRLKARSRDNPGHSRNVRSPVGCSKSKNSRWDQAASSALMPSMLISPSSGSIQRLAGAPKTADFIRMRDRHSSLWRGLSPIHRIVISAAISQETESVATSRVDPCRGLTRPRQWGLTSTATPAESQGNSSVQKAPGRNKSGHLLYNRSETLGATPR
jgi:hypothetical protein